MNFETLDYLTAGTPRQKEVYRLLTKHAVLAKLVPFTPILVGTIPISIDIETSDLDIICYWTHKPTFTATVLDAFGSEKGFSIQESGPADQGVVVANFMIDGFEIEIFGQNLPTRQQMAYRHMLIEHRLLLERGEAFRQEVIALKRKGYKTEPAFGVLLGFHQNPYIELLAYE